MPQPFNFTGTSQVQWANSSLLGRGVLTNMSKIGLVTGAVRYISDGTRLNNTGVISMPDQGYLRLYDTSVLNNQVGGVFDLQSDAVIDNNGSQAHNFNNQGLLKKSKGTAVAYIDCYLSNSGTITVESGNLNMRSLAKTFNGGTYNVTTGNFLSFNSQINVSGTLKGLLNGSLYWAGDVSVPTDATFSFTGTTQVQWANSSLIDGGTLTNASKISLVTGGVHYISGDTKLNNTGLITMPESGYLRFYDTSVLNNQVGGVFDLQSDAVIDNNGSRAHNFNNLGLLKKSGGTGTAYIDSYLSNSGTISADSGNLNLRSLAKTNTVDGIIKGIATITLPPPANFTNDGTFAPGGSPGTLTAVGTYKSSATSILDVELNGLVQGTEYDLLAITGTNAIFNGRVNVTLNFAPAVNAEFIVATTSGTIGTCNLATTTSTEFDGRLYTFNVSCRNGKQVVLRLQSVVLGIDDFELAESSIKLYPNPVRNLLTIKNTNNLELESGQIIDFTGKVITTYDLKNMGITKEISLENYASGMYFLKINGANGAITKRIVKE